MRLPPLSATLALLLVLSAAAPLPAQIVGGEWSELGRASGSASGDRFGSAIGGAGDLDGDGVPDLLIGAPEADGGGLLEVGAVEAVSGRSGASIHRLHGSQPGADFGVAVASVGDLDGDQVPDFVVGAHRSVVNGVATGSASLYSGSTGAFLHRWDGPEDDSHFSEAVTGLGDLDGDGVADLAIGAHRALGGAGVVQVYSGATFHLLYELPGDPGSLEFYAWSLADVGDIDGDGRHDLLVGAPYAWDRFRTWSGGAYLHSGATGALLLEFHDAELNDKLGWSVAGPGDLDQDGVPDLLLGSPTADVGGARAAGRVQAYSGADGRLLFQIHGEPGQELGTSLAVAGDLDQDGVLDLVAGGPGSSLPAAPSGFAVHSGKDGALLLRRLAGPGSLIGYAVAGVGGLAGRRRPGVVVSDLDGGAHSEGSVVWFGFDPFLTTSATSLSAGGGRVRVDLDFPDSEAGHPYAVLISAAGTGPVSVLGVEVPLSPDAYFRKGLAGWNPPILRGGRGLLDRHGDAQALYLPAPALHHLVGTTFHGAALSLDARHGLPRLSSVARPLTILP